jgi:hypothetical protein
MSDLPKAQPRLRGNPGQCNHPKLVALLKLRGFNETLYRCMLCGRTMTTSRLRDERQQWEDDEQEASAERLPAVAVSGSEPLSSPCAGDLVETERG